MALNAPRGVTILGSTGSVGVSTLDLIARHREAYRVEALVAGRNAALLARQARATGARLAVLADERHYGALKDALAGSGIEAGAGAGAVIEAAERPAEWVMAAIVGTAGLRPTLAAVRRGACVALANKECLVSAGEVFTAEVSRAGATLLPVDSEHNAIYQVFDFERPERVARIILTASGGPFRTRERASLARVTPAEAVAHPNWSMGAKISVDSATMMNKGLEMIEARHLFPVPPERIEVVIHPQSIIHSLVAYADGSVLAQLGSPDMRTPIAYTLAWPDRMAAPVAPLDLVKIGSLSFEAPDLKKFPALTLARAALQEGGGAPTILNAANEVAVARFLAGEIGFLDITATVERVLEAIDPVAPRTIDEVLALDGEARGMAARRASTRASG
jgi:1-deoxy-D-xylulose-5-phosphate reductoisomerase